MHGMYGPYLEKLSSDVLHALDDLRVQLALARIFAMRPAQ